MIRPAHRLVPVLFAWAAAFAVHAADSTRPSRAEILFKLTQPCPATGQPNAACKGHVVDRVIPLACGGADDPANMKWLTLAEAKEKRKWDRIGCRPGRKLVLPGQAEVITEAFAFKGPTEPIEAKPLALGDRAAPARVAPKPAAPPPEETEEHE